MKNSALNSEFSQFDRSCMARALTLARRGQGKTSPNPLVGALVAKDGRVLGEGWHRQYGGKHAEAEALDAALAAGNSLRGADLYCTLEPCCFTAPDKHQPPCTDRIIASGIRRVIIANRDPNPRVNGGGFRVLEEAGIAVQGGLLAAEGEKLNEGFFTFQRLGRPFVRLKIAQSIDGKIAAAGGDSRWITDEAARRIVHRMRSRHDAVLVGRVTALKDNPELTVRLTRGPNPLRVVLDSKLSLPNSLKLFAPPETPKMAKTLVLCSAAAAPGRIETLRERGVQVVQLKGALSLKAALSALAKQGLRSILVEGGSAVFTSFLKEGLWDQVTVFIAPLVMGEGIGAFGDLGIKAVKNAPRLYNVSIKTIGNQALFEGSRILREEAHVYRDR